MVKYFLQHWHIYQPRDNGEWAGKIDSECYRPNAQAGIFRNISFNIGPTLLDWFSKNDSQTLEKIIESDSGQAMMQGYNHRILPLCRYDEDIKTQIVWGKKHFQKYFKRTPKGMWLPETATSTRVLKEMAKEGIEYTIGAPWQIKNGQDISKPHKINLGNNLEITYFFYNELSRIIAFNQDIKNNQKIMDNADDGIQFISNILKENEMTLLAYDGETFGHHHKFTYLWQKRIFEISKQFGIETITIPEYLKKNPYIDYAQINENSSWSCHCGNLSRWVTGCNCAGGNKTYQRPLYDALNKVEDIIHDTFFTETKKYFIEPWEARNDYIDILLGNISEENFFKKHLKTKITNHKKQNIIKLLEAEYLNQLSFTSCAWFFSDFGIQTGRSIIDSYEALTKILDVIKNPKGIITDFIKNINLIEDNIRTYSGENMRYINGKEILLEYLNYKN